MKTEPLTEREAEIAHYIADFVSKWKTGPTSTEVAYAFSVSNSCAKAHMAALVRKGAATRTRDWRSIRVPRRPRTPNPAK